MVTWELIDAAPLWRYRCTLCGYRGTLEQKLRKRIADGKVVRCPGCYAKRQLAEAATESAPPPRLTFRSDVVVIKLRRARKPAPDKYKPCMRCGSLISKAVRLRKCDVCRQAEVAGIIRPFNPARFRDKPKPRVCGCCGVVVDAKFCERCALIAKAERVSWRRMRNAITKKAVK